MAEFYMPPDNAGVPGPAGPEGPAGQNGTTPFTIVGAYDNGADYTYGDAVYYAGGTYVRTGNPNNPGYPPEPGTINASWTPIAERGEPGTLDSGTTTMNSYNPVWSGTGLAYSNTPTTGAYIKLGNLVTVQIDVLFTSVTNFGTGQYSLTLPFNSEYHTDVYGGSIHDVVNQGVDHYSIKGHLSPASNVMTIWNIGSSAKDEPVDYNSPFNLAVADKMHMSFTYICE